MQTLPERTANFILRNLRENLLYPWCQRMPKRFELRVVLQLDVVAAIPRLQDPHVAA
jgi:hypothetical protein